MTWAGVTGRESHVISDSLPDSSTGFSRKDSSQLLAEGELLLFAGVSLRFPSAPPTRAPRPTKLQDVDKLPDLCPLCGKKFPACAPVSYHTLVVAGWTQFSGGHRRGGWGVNCSLGPFPRYPASCGGDICPFLQRKGGRGELSNRLGSKPLSRKALG